VGALLATGLVILGTHLATAIAGHPADLDSQTVSSTNSLAPAATPTPAIEALGPRLVDAIRMTGRSVASIDSQIGSKEIHTLAVVVRSDGMLVAPSEAVAHASSVLVTLANGVVYVGQIEGSDVAAGVTLLHINGVTGLPPATLDGPAILSTGQMALAVVAPGGMASSLGSVLTADTSPAVSGARIVDAMTTDLPVRPDPIGGPLVNASGQIAGIVIGEAHGRAVAIPTWLLAPVVQQLMSTQSVTPGYLGLSCVTVQGTAYTTGGVRVLSVDPGSAAANAAIQPGDLIVALDDLAVSSKAELEGQLHILKPGSHVTITVLRDGLERTLSTRLAGA
jgi:putative serine protease PepD